MASVFKALSDATRRQVLTLLKDGPLSAGEISGHFPFSKPTISAHLGVLKEAGLVLSVKQGQKVIYHLQISVLEDALLGFAEEFGLDGARTRGRMTAAKEGKTS